MFQIAEALNIVDPYTLSGMSAELFSEWVAYLQIKEGSFETEEDREAARKKEEEAEARKLDTLFGVSGESGQKKFKGK
ncbi:hypothetical protein QTO01_11230 [Vibrio mytili]|uniref:hypothetical protein n=1 Tax=Vibrio mytili TaxID=50718 RepID=UPI002F3F9703